MHRAVPVTSMKSMVGHCLGAAGALEAAALALTRRRGAIPPTINHAETDPECEIDVVANHAREQRVRCGVSTSLGFGGNDAALVITAIVMRQLKADDGAAISHRNFTGSVPPTGLNVNDEMSISSLVAGGDEAREAEERWPRACACHACAKRSRNAKFSCSVRPQLVVFHAWRAPARSGDGRGSP